MNRSARARELRSLAPPALGRPRSRRPRSHPRSDVSFSSWSKDPEPRATAGRSLLAVVPDSDDTPVLDGAAPAWPRPLAVELAGSRLEEAFTVGKVRRDSSPHGETRREMRVVAARARSRLVARVVADPRHRVSSQELFLVFAAPDGGARPAAVRLHFGMAGSLAVRRATASAVGTTAAGVAPWRRGRDPSLRLCFVASPRAERKPPPGGASQYVVVEAWETTVTYPKSANNARHKLMELSSRDVCSVLFNAQEAFTVLRKKASRLIIADALLDQTICPGVGNIIKVEALHKSGIDPRRLVSSLADAELRRLVRHARQFSMDWLNTGRAGAKLVYNRTSCGTCRGATVKMQKIGGGDADGGRSDAAKRGHGFMARVTFWCTACQPREVGSTRGAPGPASNPATTASPATGHAGPRNRAALAAQRPPARCPQHGLAAVKLRRVRKDDRNALRIFHVCGRRGCPFFEWADAPFAACQCGRRTVLRVSKTASSGGKWFLCCAAGGQGARGSRGCGHFEWATDAHLAPIRSLLTPLL